MATSSWWTTETYNHSIILIPEKENKFNHVFFYLIFGSSDHELLGLSLLWCLCSHFSAHTKESARALTNMIKMTFPGSRLVLVVAMASDKDHLGFARELLSGLISFRLCMLYNTASICKFWSTNMHSTNL